MPLRAKTSANGSTDCRVAGPLPWIMTIAGCGPGELGMSSQPPRFAVALWNLTGWCDTATGARDAASAP